MSEAKRERVAAAIKAIESRVAYLAVARNNNPPMFASKGMVSLATALDQLARRHLEEVEQGMVISGALEAGRLKAAREQSTAAWLQPTPAEQPDATMLQRYGWYVGYCTRLLELCEAAQFAARKGVLAIRSAETAAELRTDGSLVSWLSRDLQALQCMIHLPTDCADWSASSALWPDGHAVPPGGLLLADAEAWATSSGIAQPGELLALLGSKPPAPVLQLSGAVLSLVRADGPAPPSSDLWTPERLARRRQELEADGLGKPMYRLAKESGIDGRKIRHQIKALREAGAMGAIAGQLGK
jgi:hypothetical protein